MLSLRLGGKGFIDGIQPALSAFVLYSMVFILTNVLVTMHQIVRGVNKLQRLLFSLCSYLGSSNVLLGEQLLRNFRQWLSPPNPSINHSSARRAIHSGTTKWFIEDVRYKEWKATGPLIWVHGKCISSLPSTPLPLLTIIPRLAGSGKTILWHVCYLRFSWVILMLSLAPQSFKTSKPTLMQT
jgi:hypothetical protein